MTGNIVQAYQVNVANISSANVTANGAFVSNGYVNLGSLIIQWGNFTLPSSTQTTVTFPIAFPNKCFVAVPSQGDSASYGYPFATDNLSTTGFTCQASAGGINAGTGYYIAIGN